MKLNLEKLHKKNICLIGLMGSGKSVVGRFVLQSGPNIFRSKTLCLIYKNNLGETNDEVSYLLAKPTSNLAKASNQNKRSRYI